MKMSFEETVEINEIIQDHRKLLDWSALKNKTTANTTEFVLPIDMVFNDGHVLSITVYSILMTASALGNITLLYLLLRDRTRCASRIDIMLINLCIADLLVTFLMMPTEIAWSWTVIWVAGDLMCRIMAFFRTFGLYLSSAVLVCISIDRYYAVLKPFKISETRGRGMLTIAWISSTVHSVPQAFIFHVESHPKVKWFEQCVTFHSFPDEIYNVLYSVMCMLVMYAIPLVVITFCYASIYIEIYKKSKNLSYKTELFRRSNDDVLCKAKQRTLRMTVTIVIVFVVCWTPYYVMSIWYWLDRESAMLIDQKIQKGLFLFASTNSCMNPLVYGIFNIRSNKRERTVSFRNTFRQRQ
ncbi:adipokinetic hormone/corazonin-related peptide receptor variant I [Condylostylus longicornis]|uniref:adipokinetic hormone/corazonin-related peptide receptor variant I n=1 Tax=Condylostylus longicornis TaxID=2530218 RepID=UPI00244DF33F|nr:adipokinetic hormone/corazonin-related peptide receptor variant I [Condylostylus longicornis]